MTNVAGEPRRVLAGDWVTGVVIARVTAVVRILVTCVPLDLMDRGCRWLMTVVAEALRTGVAGRGWGDSCWPRTIDGGPWRHSWLGSLELSWGESDAELLTGVAERIIIDTCLKCTDDGGRWEGRVEGCWKLGNEPARWDDETTGASNFQCNWLTLILVDLDI